MNHLDQLLASGPALSVVDGAAPHKRTASDIDEPVHVRFARHARARPEAPAVRFGVRSLSYGALDARAERLAHRLIAAGVRVESMVAVCLSPSIEVLVALLAIFKAGGVYVPIDPSHPRALVAQIVDEVKPPLVLTDTASREVLPVDCVTFLLDGEAALGLGLPETGHPLPSVGLDHACYVLYTSGTTGRAKGVVATHRNLAHYLGVARARFAFRADDVFCSLARYTFSISFFELLSPLACGGSVVLATRDAVLDPARLTELLATVTVVHAGPSLLTSLFRHLREHAGAPRLSGIRHASTGGDMVPPRVLSGMREVFTDAELFVLYGCTEISCMGTGYAIPREGDLTRTLVGTPFAETSVRVVDEHGRLVPRGESGEIYFAGKGIARRYLARPELSSEKFISIDGQRFYRTGDIGKLHADGNLEILGRRDFQVQLRGIRVELGGIEHTICALGLAAQAVVVASRRDEHDVRLVAFVVDAQVTELASLRRALGQQLPDYMLPQALCVLPALPLTANGKLDRRQLVALAERASARPQRVAARAPISDPRERAIAAAFEQVLGVAQVGREDDFFDLGGHSLTAVLLLRELQERLGIRVSPSALFEHPTVRALAAAMDAEGASEQAPILLSDSADAPALFMLLGVHLYRELAQALTGRYAVYGVYAARELALLGGADAAPSVQELAREYIAILRRQQPKGPYHIGGMSFGGIVAYEVAQQLEDDGELVASLVLLDAVLPESHLSKLRRLASLRGRELVQEVARRVRTRFIAGRDVASTFLQHADDAQLGRIEAQRQAAYRAAALRYLPQMRPFHGATTLVVANRRLRRDRLQDPRCGFARLVPSLRVRHVEAEHLELLEAPLVTEVAAILPRASGLSARPEITRALARCVDQSLAVRAFSCE